MKFIKYLTPIIVLSLACGLSAAPEQPTPPPESESDAVVESISPLAAPDSPLPTPVSVDLSWQSDATEPLISATFCCGFSPVLVPMNYLADATLWGDGRLVWVEYNNDGSRRVLQGQLPVDQIEALLNRIEATGFFGWDDLYANQTVADAAEKCIKINLSQNSKQVCEYVEGAPPAFHQLYSELAQGVGVTGSDFIPERGYLQTIVLDSVDESVPVDANWSAEAMGFSLAEAVEGRWVEGEALLTVWQITNTKWHGMIVQERDRFYQISVQVPGLGLNQLPGQ